MDYEIALAIQHTEIWAGFACTISTSPRLLEVSSLGRRRVTSIKTGRALNLDYGSNMHGYRRFGRFGDAHRCIAQVFVPTDKLTSNDVSKNCSVNHIDGNKANNTVSNLEWCTHTENIRHAFTTSLNKGYKRTAETKAKLSKALKGKKRSAETKAKMSKALKGRKLSAEHKAKMSGARKDLNTHKFTHVDGSVVVGAYKDLRANAKELFGFSSGSVQKLKQGQRVIVKGWSYAGYNQAVAHHTLTSNRP